MRIIPVKLSCVKASVPMILDDEDYELLSKLKWCVQDRKYHYAISQLNGVKIKAHRFIMKANEGECVDHKDGNPLNNQKQNLRICTKAQNLWNMGKSKANKSGFKGVSFDKGKWAAEIWVNNKKHYLGRFITKEEAHEAYKAGAKRFHGEFAKW